MTLHASRPYQADLKTRTKATWAAGARNVLDVLPTGGGKTHIFASLIAEERAGAVAIAHRRELVSQMSLALARENVRHRVIGPAEVARECAAIHIEELGRDYTDPRARVAAAGVDTLVNMDPRDPWFAQVGLWVQDEAHHVLKENKWGRACAMFPNARGLGVTATPMRADGKGLGRHADGLFDEMLVGPSMRELISMGFLSDYRLIIAESHFDVSDVPVGDSGDYSPAKLAAARRKAREVTGDVVKTYLTYAPFKRGVTFEVDVESATETAAAFRAAGVPAEVVTAKTPSAERRAILRRFRNGQVLQLVNVDLFGEGFDLPAIEVVSFARPTTSYGLYVQQFGRALRLMKGKGRAIIIDHVGAWKVHGLPDNGRDWTLDRRERASRGTPSDVIPLRHCPKCATAYERVFPSCPECGDSPEPAVRSGPEHVDGDLFELDPDVLARMRGEIARIDGAALIPQGVSHIAQLAARKNHMLRQQASHSLRHTLALWIGWQNSKGRDDRESFRRFWFRYGVDVASAQALNAADSAALQARIKNDLDRANVIDGSVTNA